MSNQQRRRPPVETVGPSLADALRLMDLQDATLLSQLGESGLPGTEEIDADWPEVGRRKFLALLLDDKLPETKSR